LVFLIPGALIAIESLSPRRLLVRPGGAFKVQGSRFKVQRWALSVGRLVRSWRASTKGISRIVTMNAQWRGARTAEPTSSETLVHADSAVRAPRNAVARRFDLLSVPLLGPFLRAQAGRRFLQITLLIIAIAVIVDGLFGPQISSANLAGVLPWTYWRVL